MKRLAGVILVFVLLAVVFGVAATEYREEKLLELQKTNAKEDLMSNSYENLRISLLPTKDFSVGRIELFSGATTKEVDYQFQSLEEMYLFMEEIFSYQFDLKEIYLYVDPIEICERNIESGQDYYADYQEYLEGLFSLYEEVQFYCVLPAYSVEYWKESEGKWEAKERYLTYFVEQVGEYTNVQTYYFGHEEWLIANPGNFVDTRMNNSDIQALLTAYVMANDSYLLTEETLEERLEATKEIWERTSLELFDDLSKYEVVLIGDSILGNYTDSVSIAGVIKAKTNANIYICSQGGATAVPTDSFPFDFRDMVKRFLTNAVDDLDESTIKKEILRYHETTKGKREKIFVINFGINDYYKGINIEDYEACLAEGIQELKESYPDALYIVMGANYVTMYENGTLLHNEDTRGLISYVEAARRVALAEKTIFLDNYAFFYDNFEDVDEVLVDKTHPNEYGRYLIGKRIIEAISTKKK